MYIYIYIYIYISIYVCVCLYEEIDIINVKIYFIIIKNILHLFFISNNFIRMHNDYIM